MEFLDEQIAKLQKEAQMERKYDRENSEELIQEDLKELPKDDLKELTQEEVNEAIKNGLLEKSGENLVFEKKTCFKGKIIIPIIENFFDEYQEEENGYCWAKKQEFSMVLVKIDSENNSDNIEDLLEKVKGFYKDNDVYIEFFRSKRRVI